MPNSLTVHTGQYFDKDAKVHDVNKQDMQDHRAQFNSRHLNIIFKSQCCCNLVVLWKQAENLGMDSEDGSDKEKPHTYTVGEGKPATSAAMFLPNKLSCPCCLSLYHSFWFVALHNCSHKKCNSKAGSPRSSGNRVRNEVTVAPCHLLQLSKNKQTLWSTNCCRVKS